MDSVKTIEEIPYGFEGTGEVKGFTFHKERETDTHYVYSVKDYSLGSDSRYWFEAFERRQTPKCLDFSLRLYSDNHFKEVYPKAKDFGVWAKTFSELENAEEWIRKQS